MDYELKATLRTESGKGAARRLRSLGLVPGIAYGPGFNAIPLAVAANELEKLLKRIDKDSTLFDLKIERDGEIDTKAVLIRELQIHPYRRRFLHIDFYAMAMDKDIDVEVPLMLQGEAPGVKEGGILNQLVWTVNIRCLPRDIPENIRVDVSELNIGDSVHVGAIKDRYPVQFLDDESQALVTVEVPAPVGAEAPAAEGPVEGEEVATETGQGEEVTKE